MLKLMDWADRFAGNEFQTQRKRIREAVTDKNHPYYSFVRRLFHDVDPKVMKTAAVNFFRECVDVRMAETGRMQGKISV